METSTAWTCASVAPTSDENGDPGMNRNLTRRRRKTQTQVGTTNADAHTDGRCSMTGLQALRLWPACCIAAATQSAVAALGSRGERQVQALHVRNEGGATGGS